MNEETIIKSLGEFDSEKNILKKYARRGQCFSTTKYILKLNPNEVDFNIPDVMRNGFNFSDGCGYISKELCDIICNNFGGL